MTSGTECESAEQSTRRLDHGSAELYREHLSTWCWRAWPTRVERRFGGRRVVGGMCFRSSWSTRCLSCVVGPSHSACRLRSADTEKTTRLVRAWSTDESCQRGTPS